jgi:hypothetical protein
MIIQAIKNLVGSDVTLELHGETYEDIVWRDEREMPSKEAVQAEIDNLQADYDAKQYQRDRVYPSIGEQLDMIFHAGLGGDEFQAAIQAVKDAHPKPE